MQSKTCKSRLFSLFAEEGIIIVLFAVQLHVMFRSTGHQPFLFRAIRAASEVLFTLRSFHARSAALMPTISNAGKCKGGPVEISAGSLHATGPGIS